MPSVNGQHVIIVGGGATGTLLACHLLREAAAPRHRVTIVERTSATGLGIAYSTVNPSHLLNVRVSNMSAFPDRPEHFWNWVLANRRREVAGCEASFCFVPRSIYGAYLASLLEDHRARDDDRLRVARGEAVAFRDGPAGVEVRLDGGSSIRGDLCILATGNEAPAARYPRSVSPWTDPGAAGIRPDSSLLIVGSGLTMVDYILSLQRAGHSGPILALSRHGLLPQVHRDVAPEPIAAADVPFGAEVSAMMRWLRGRIARGVAEGRDWRCTFDGLRPYVQRIWQSWPEPARRRFLRHARAWWDVHRHRMAPQVCEAISGAIQSGQLRIAAGKTVATQAGATGVSVTYRLRGSAATETYHAANVVECVGISVNPRASKNPILRDLLAQGLTRSDALGLGIDVSDDCAAIDRDGRASRRLFAAGPLTRGALWEIGSIPDIRAQCAELAQRLAGLPPPPDFC